MERTKSNECGNSLILMKQALKRAAWLAAVAALPAVLSWGRLSEADDRLLPYEVTLNDPRFPREDAVWVDARSREEYEQGHVTGAILLNEENWDSLLGNLFEAWKPPRAIIVYCNAGCQASQKVAERLRDLGIDPVYFLKGGYDAWKSNYPAKAKP
jgi:rhodanese-related sulfurtransferase